MTLYKSEVIEYFCSISLWCVQPVVQRPMICPALRTACFDENEVVAHCLPDYGWEEASFVFFNVSIMRRIC